MEKSCKWCEPPNINLRDGTQMYSLSEGGPWIVPWGRHGEGFGSLATLIVRWPGTAGNETTTPPQPPLLLLFTRMTLRSAAKKLNTSQALSGPEGSLVLRITTI